MVYPAIGALSINDPSVRFTDKLIIDFSDRNPDSVIESTNSLEGLTDEGFIHFARHQKKLQELNIMNNPHITDKALFSVADNCKELKKLVIYGVSEITGEGLLRILKVTKLKRLIIGCVESISSTFFAKARKACPTLEKLTIWCDEGSLEDFFKTLSPLRSLTIKGFFFNDTQGKWLAQNLQDITRICFHCTQVSDATTAELALYGKNIQKLKFVRNCITDNSLKIIQNHFPSLIKLVLKNNPTTHDQIVLLRKMRPNLIIKCLDGEEKR